MSRLAIALVLLVGVGRVHASDWPQWLGPHRNGTAPDVSAIPAWPKDGPSQLWRQPVGQGFSGPVVQGDDVILCHRLHQNEIVACYHARTGQPRWQFEYATAYVDDFGFDEGPRATPAIFGGRVFTFGAEGVLHCLSLADGKRVWCVDTQKEFRATKGFFGMACSPLAEGEVVLVNLGGQGGAGIVAFDQGTGAVAWKATQAEASYSSPVAATIRDQRYAFFFNREGLVALNPATGRVHFEFPWRPSMNASVNAATPQVMDDRVFISTSYGRGAALLRFHESAPETIWAGDESLSNHYSTSVHHNGYLYGFHGRQEQGCVLRCVELDTGKVMWTQPGLGAGTIIVVADQLLVLTEKGELHLAPASQKNFKPIATAQILGSDTRAHPALANGLLFARDKRQLIGLNLN